MSGKTWKDHLLSSGLPLEHSVTQALGKLSMVDPREFRYTRANEQGVQTTFSVDVHAECLVHQPNIWLELFVECKYRHESTNWIFTPSDYAPFAGPEFAELFVSLVTPGCARKMNRGLLNRYAEKYALCGKGVELFSNDSTHATIERALSQVRYAIPNRAAAGLNSLTRSMNSSTDVSRPPTVVLVPMIVTTAALWRIRPEVTIEALRQANEIADVATSEEVLVVHHPPDNELANYSTATLRRDLSTNAKQELDAHHRDGHEGFIKGFAQWVPSTFVVIHYTRFSKAVENLVRFLDREDMVTSAKEED